VAGGQARVAIVTGGSRGLGRAMAFELARCGVRTIIAAHLIEDRDEVLKEAAAEGVADLVHFQQADLRNSAGCDASVAFARSFGGPIDVLVNNAGLTLTFVAPDLYRRSTPRRFYESTDEVIRGIYETNCIATEMMAARVAPAMVEQGWGRIINVTTMLPTMQRIGFCPYGASKAALEMSSMVWARELAGTGVTVNVLNPGGGANTPGLAQEMRDASARGEIDRLVEPWQMRAPLRWLVSAAANDITGMRVDANLWRPELDPQAAAQLAARRCGLQLLDPTPVAE
jgi:NAD(P)-dependent dehydrogenase (short-subunit alcohol dehydrogenase family)